jgi:hypothetical protein
MVGDSSVIFVQPIRSNKATILNFISNYSAMKEVYNFFCPVNAALSGEPLSGVETPRLARRLRREGKPSENRKRP